METATPATPKKLTVRQAAFIGVGSMVGAGIFSLLGTAGEVAGAAVWISFLIPSSSGLATVAMPIMAPLADFAGASRSLVVTAYQSASGLLNLVTPTSAVVMGGLAIARVPYGKYLKFVWPLVAMLGGLTIVMLAIGAAV